MSGLFDQPGSGPGGGGRGPVRSAEPPGPSRRSRALIITAVVLVVAFLALTGASSFWTERLWFSSFGYGGVFTTLVWTRIALFAVFGVLMALAVGVSMWLAFKFRPVLRPNLEQTSLDRYREAVIPIRRWLLVAISLLMGVFAGTSGAGQWRNYQLWRNGGSFGSEDPYFNRDLGFYVFDLPWFHYVVDFAMAATIVALMAAAVVHYLFGGIALQGPGPKLSGAAQVQLSVLVGLFIVAKSVDYWLDRFDLLTKSGSRFDGMNFVGENAQLPAKNILAGIAIICALLFFLNIWRRTWMLPTMGVALLALSSVLLGLIWPALVQQFQVKPAEPDKERPYIQNNIDATRAAYDVADSETTPYNPAPQRERSQAEKEALRDDIVRRSGVRLVDPKVVQPAFEQLQEIRGFYTVADVLDVDTYNIEGNERDLVLGVRELDQSGLDPSARNWANLHTVYTHGYGVVAAYGNQRDASNQNEIVSDDSDQGEPSWAEQNLPPVGELTELNREETGTQEGYQPRIYFGEKSPLYSIVGKPSADAADVEFDRPGGTNDSNTGESESDSGADGPSGDDVSNTYDGAAGVEVGSFLHKLLYAVKFSEPNIVLSGRVHENSKILYDRDPKRMIEKIAPWLTVDGDPYPAVVDGKITWILDGYTVTDRYPLSEKDSFQDMTDDSLRRNTQFQTLPTDEVNYVRNAVKATVDAYDGTVNLYAWDESDPILRAWSKVFPGVVKEKSAIPEGLLQHMRYPEDLFKVQRFQLAAYHVTDADDFYRQNDLWQVPVDPNDSDSKQPPYRLSVPSGSSADGPDVYSLTSTFTPNNRDNLAAFLSVDADGSQEDTYGTLRIKRMAVDRFSGPGQIANAIGQDRVLSQETLPYRQNDSRPIFGNLLTLPINDQLLYVQPVYTQRSSGAGAYPILRFVAVSFGDQVGVGQTLDEAVSAALGIDPSDGTSDGGGGNGSGGGDGGDNGGGTPSGGTVSDLLDQANDKFAEANQALEDGDLAGYQTAVDEAKALVDRAIRASEAADGTGSGASGDPSASASPSPSASASGE